MDLTFLPCRYIGVGQTFISADTQLAQIHEVKLHIVSDSLDVVNEEMGIIPSCEWSSINVPRYDLHQ